MLIRIFQDPKPSLPLADHVMENLQRDWTIRL